MDDMSCPSMATNDDTRTAAASSNNSSSSPAMISPDLKEFYDVLAAVYGIIRRYAEIDDEVRHKYHK